MALGTALSAGLDSFMAVRGEQRKQQSHDLQTEGMTLRNQGYRLNNQGQELDNQLDRESYGYRLDQERGNADFTTGRGRSALAEARQEEEIEQRGLRVGQEAEKLNYQRNRANKTGHEAIEAASDARVAVGTESSRANKIHSDAEKAYQQAVQAGVTTRDEASSFYGEQLLGIANGRTINEALQDESFAGTAIAQLETQFDSLLSEGQRVAGVVYNEEAGGYMIATRMPDGSIKPITDNRSADGDDPVTVFSEDEVSSALFGESADTYRTTQAQNQGAQNVVNQQVGAAQEEHAQGVEQLGQQRVAVQAAREAVPSLRELDSERVRLRGRIHSLEQQKTRGFGSGSVNAPINEEISELESELETVDTRLSDLQNTHGDLLDRPVEELDQIDGQLASQLNNQGDQLQRTLGSIGSSIGEAQRVSTASGGDVSTEDAMRNITGQRPSLASLSPSEQLEQRASDVGNSEKITESVRGSIDRVARTFEDRVASLEAKDRSFAQEDVGRGIRSLEAAIFRSSNGENDVFDKLATGTPREKMGAEVLLSLALEQSIGQGGDVGTRIDGILADYSPASIEMAAEFANDEVFAGAKSSDRYGAVQRAVELMETQNLNSTQAKTRALQEMNSRN